MDKTFHFINLVCIAALTGFIGATFILVAEKYKLFTKYRERKKNWMPGICYLCVICWTCAVVAFLIIDNFRPGMNLVDFFLIVLASTALARKVTSDVPTE